MKSGLLARSLAKALTTQSLSKAAGISPASYVAGHRSFSTKKPGDPMSTKRSGAISFLLEPIMARIEESLETYTSDRKISIDKHISAGIDYTDREITKLVAIKVDEIKKDILKEIGGYFWSGVLYTDDEVEKLIAKKIKELKPRIDEIMEEYKKILTENYKALLMVEVTACGKELDTLREKAFAKFAEDARKLNDSLKKELTACTANGISQINKVIFDGLDLLDDFEKKLEEVLRRFSESLLEQHIEELDGVFRESKSILLNTTRTSLYSITIAGESAKTEIDSKLSNAVQSIQNKKTNSLGELCIKLISAKKDITKVTNDSARSIEDTAKGVANAFNGHAAAIFQDTSSKLSQVKNQLLADVEKKIDDSKATAINNILSKSQEWRKHFHIKSIWNYIVLNIAVFFCIYLIDAVEKQSRDNVKEEIMDLLAGFSEFSDRLKEGSIHKIHELVDNTNKFSEMISTIKKFRYLAALFLNSQGEESGYLCVGGLLLIFSEFEVSMHVFNHILEHNKDNADAHFGKAYALFQLGLIDDAYQSINCAIAIEQRAQQSQHRNKLFQADIENYQSINCVIDIEQQAQQSQHRNKLLQADILVARSDNFAKERKEPHATRALNEAVENLQSCIKYFSQDEKNSALQTSAEKKLAIVRQKLANENPVITSFASTKFHESPVTTHYECALLIRQSQQGAGALEKWEALTLDVSTKTITEVYYHKVRNHLVFVYKDNHSAWERFLGMPLDDAMADLNVKMNFVKDQIARKSKGETRPSVTFTGFGYGAAFAEGILHYTANHEDELDIESVTFNSAGAQPLVDQIFSNHIRANERPKVHALGYLSAPDAINTANQQATRAIQLPILAPLNLSMLERTRDAVASIRFLSCIGRTSQLSVKYTIDDFIPMFDPETGCLLNPNKLREVRKWPVSKDERAKYIEVTARLQPNVTIPNVKLSVAEQVKLDACYHSVPLNLKQARLDDFTTDMKTYLNAYVRTNGQIGIANVRNKALHTQLMKFSLDRQKVVIHSDLSAEDFKRYIKKCVNELSHEELHNYRNSGIFRSTTSDKKYFHDTCRLFIGRAQAARGTSDLSERLSTVESSQSHKYR